MATQICDRTITYRNFDYSRAETIIQEEEYLEDEDFDDIRFFRRNGHILENIEQAEKKYGKYSFDDFNAHESVHHREKRLANLVIPSYFTNLTNLMCFEFDQNKFDKLQTKLNFFLVSERKKRDLSDLNSWGCLIVKLIAILSALAAWKFGNPQPPSPDPPEVPGPEDENNPDNAGNPGNVLDLVPFGLTPVAVFPPFRRLRTPGVDAVAVIWREPSGTVPNDQLPDDGRGGEPFRKRRDLGYCPEKTLFEKLLLNIRCYKPRLDALFGKNSHDHGSYGRKKRDTIHYGYNHVDYGFQDSCPGNCGTIEDCFDLPCPRYGARVRYTYTIPRNANPGYGKNYENYLTERQTGEGFRSRAPPDCRVIAG